MAYFFTSDLHFGDERLNLYGRDLIAKSSYEIDELIINNWNSMIGNDDITFLLGDICYDISKINYLTELNGKKILIKGNYDEQIPDDTWLEYVDEIVDDKIIRINDEQVYLNHYPTNGRSDMFNIVGHIHGTWKVQRNMINCGVDAHHFYPWSLEQIKFQINGIRKFYDENVFAGTLDCNLKYKV